MARHRAVPEPGTHEMERVDDQDPARFDEDLRVPRRVPRWLLLLLGLAVAVFVAGVVWTVSTPSANDETAGPPAAAASSAHEAGGTPSVALTPSASPQRSSATPVPSGRPSAGAGTPPSLSASATVDSTWTNQGIRYVQVDVRLDARVTGVTRWRVVVTCAQGSALDVYHEWDAVLVGQAGSAATFGNADYNGTLTPGSTTTFGFQATWVPADEQHPVPTCTASLTAA